MATLDRLSCGRALTTAVPAGGPSETEALIARARRGGPGPALLQDVSGGHAVVGARLADGLAAAAWRRSPGQSSHDRDVEVEPTVAAEIAEGPGHPLGLRSAGAHRRI